MKRGGLDVLLAALAAMSCEATSPPADSGGAFASPCAAGTKLCEAQCVSLDDPRFGCAADGCDACVVAGGAPACSAGTCSVGRCDPGRADCNLNAADGCETNTDADAHACGGCGVTCGNDAVCDGGRCAIACGTSRVACAGACVDPESDPDACGACGVVCPGAAHGARTCTVRVCGLSCDAGYRVCAGVCAAESPSACGPSCAVCPVPDGGHPTCDAGQCGVACDAGFSPCKDGCCPVAPARALAAANDHACAVTSGGALECWGANEKGQLGTGDTVNRASPTPVSLVADAAAPFAGPRVTGAISATGEATVWGNPPLAIPLGAGVSAIVWGGWHGCAIQNGGLACWGLNFAGQLGIGPSPAGPYKTPMPVIGLGAGVQAVAAGVTHTCAITAASGVRCWGRNDLGQVGNGPNGAFLDVKTPVDVLPLTGIVAIATGGSHSCALRTDGTIACWGDNSNGQLGVMGVAQTNVPRDVPVDRATAIAAGDFGTCALLPSGRIMCWGLSKYLGVDVDGGVLPPTEVVGVNDVVSIHVAGASAFAILRTGAIRAWGLNDVGQLGDGSTTDRLAPVRVVLQ
jgi:alpha-tubulin suppressor-like RCC1 family protein